ncbi:MAG: hypothetical protein FJX25_12735 [Alphaproteobacteria bacterium]|nr:hypothetical protein [Alphaproteobacteria bacterium]
MQKSLRNAGSRLAAAPHGICCTSQKRTFGRGKRVICMDGLDLYDMLEQEITLTQALECEVPPRPRHLAWIICRNEIGAI